MPYAFQQPFDARQVEPASFAPPPVLADYHVRILDGEAKATKDNTGGFLELILEIMDPGPYAGRKIPYRLNLFNPNQQTVEIAYKQLSSICHVTGVFNVQDVRQFVGIPFIATIGPQTNNPQYANVFTVKDINGNLPGKASQAQPAAPPAYAPTAPAAPPAYAPAPPSYAPPGQPPAAAPWAPPGAPAAPPTQQPWQPPQAAAAPPAYAPAAPPAWQPGAAAAPGGKPPWA